MIPAVAPIPVQTSAVLPGIYTVADLTTKILPSLNQAKYAFVSDLGGGADMVLSNGQYWKHIRQGVVTDVPGGGSIAITPLKSPPIMRITSASALPSTLMTISALNLYPGATYRVIIPGPLATLATFGVQVGAITPSIALVGASWSDLQWNGTALIKIAGGLL